MKPVLLAACGAKTYETLKNVCLPQEVSEVDYGDIIGKVKTHFKPEPLIIYERYMFGKRSRKTDERIADFAVDLKRLTATCKFGNFLDEALCMQFVVGLSMSKIQSRLMQESTLAFESGFLVVILDTTAEEQESDATKKGQENSTEENRIGQEGERRKSYSAAVIDGIKRNSTIYVGDSIIRKTDSRLSKGEDVVVCLPGARIEHVTERVEKIVGRGNGGTILVHVGTNNTDKEGTTAIVEKYRKLLKKTKQARLGQIILSGILPVCGNRIQGYRNSKRMAVNGMVERLCKEEYVGYVDMWDSFVGNEELYFRDGLHLSGKGAAVLAEGLSGAVASGLGKVRYLN